MACCFNSDPIHWEALLFCFVIVTKTFFSQQQQLCRFELFVRSALKRARQHKNKFISVSNKRNSGPGSSCEFFSTSFEILVKPVLCCAGASVNSCFKCDKVSPKWQKCFWPEWKYRLVEWTSDCLLFDKNGSTAAADWHSKMIDFLCGTIYKRRFFDWRNHGLPDSELRETKRANHSEINLVAFNMNLSEHRKH